MADAEAKKTATDKGFYVVGPIVSVQGHHKKAIIRKVKRVTTPASIWKPSLLDLNLRQRQSSVIRMFDQYEQVTEQPILHPRCPCCGQAETIIWVNGQGQCAQSKMNVMLCCDGAHKGEVA